MPLYSYQRRGIAWLRQGYSFLAAVKPGGGKTRLVSTWFKLMPREKLHAIVIAPPLVIYDAWTEELDNVSIEFGHGHKDTFEAACNAFACGKIPVLLTTPEMFSKLENKREVLRACRQLVLDESTKYKDASSKRFEAARRILKRYWKIEQVVAMTGTLLPKHYLQLFSQLWLVGQTSVFNTDSYPEFRDRYFYTKPKRDYDWIFFPGMQEKLEERIAPWILQPEEHEYANMPPIIETEHLIQMPDRVKKLHRQMDRDRTITIKEQDVLAANKGVALFKCLQICSGGVYRYTDPNDPSSGREWIPIHRGKQNFIKDFVEGAGANVLIMYSFRSSFDILKKLFPKIKDLRESGSIDQWKQGKLPIAAGHPGSMGHGLNLQTGGNIIVFFDMTPDAELWWQSIKRLHRGDIHEPVFVHYMIADFKGSKDRYVADMLYKKYENQEELYRRLRQLNA